MVTVVVLCVFVFGGCRQPASSSELVVPAGEYNTPLAVNAATTVNLISIAPDIANTTFTSYDVTVKNSDNSPVREDPHLTPVVKKAGSPVVSFSLKLHAGLYSVTVDAYTDSGLAATATAPLTVKSSGVSSCSLTLQPIHEGVGELAWRLTLPADATGALTLFNAGKLIPINIAGNTSLPLQGSATLPVGTYNLRLTITNSTGEFVVTPPDKVCVVCANLTTTVENDYTAYSFANTIPVSGSVIIENPSKTTTSGIVVTACDANGNPFEPAVTRLYAAPVYNETVYSQPYTLALPAGAANTLPIIKASFAEASTAYGFTAKGASPEEPLTPDGAENVNPELRIVSTNAIVVRGKVVVDNPANIKIGDVTVTATGTYTTTKATLVSTDNANATATYKYALPLPPSAFGATPAIGVTFGAYFPGPPDSEMITSPKPSELTKNVDDADFHVRFYGLTAESIRDSVKLAAAVANRANNVATDTIYLWGELAGSDLDTLGAVIGDKRLRLDMTHGVVKDGIIPAAVFAGCRGLESVAIGKNVSAIGEGAFAGCVHLASIAVDKHSPYYKAFDNVLYTADETTLVAYAAARKSDHYIIPNTIKRVANGAFANATNLKRVILGDSVIEIGAGAFRDCSGLEAVALTSAVRAIGDDAYNGCTALRSLSMNDRLSSIGARAFKACGIEGAIAFPDTLSSLGAECFQGNGRLTGVSFGAYRVDEIPERAFADCGLKSLAVPNAVERVGKEAFANNPAIETLTLGSGLSVIDDGAFMGCSGFEVLVFPAGLVSVGDSAFKGCVKIAALNFPNGLDSIGNSAFENCYSFKYLDFPNSVTTIGASAFKGCMSWLITERHIWNSELVDLEEGDPNVYGDGQHIRFGSGVRTIGDCAFEGCATGSVDLPAGVQTVGARAFCNNTHLQEIRTRGCVQTIGDEAFAECKELDDVEFSAVTLGKRAFYNCVEIDDVKVADNLVTIGDSAFEGCTELSSADMGSDLVTIGNSAFAGCDSLYDVILGDKTLENIGDEAFSECSKLHVMEFGYKGDASSHYDLSGALDFPHGLKTLGTRAFYNCSKLKAVYLWQDSISSMGSEVFSGCSGMSRLGLPRTINRIGPRMCYNCSNLRKIEFYNGVESICESAFENSGLLTVTFPRSLQRVEARAFSGCNNLDRITYGGGLKYIGELAFQDCVDFDKISIPGSVTEIATRAFSGCDNADEITIDAGVTTLGAGVFNGCSDLKRLSIPATIQSIGNSAFRDCDNIERVTIGAGVPQLGIREHFDFCYFENNQTAGVYAYRNSHWEYTGK
jgi:hypothetical protein